MKDLTNQKDTILVHPKKPNVIVPLDKFKENSRPYIQEGYREISLSEFMEQYEEEQPDAKGPEPNTLPKSEDAPTLDAKEGDKEQKEESTEENVVPEPTATAVKNELSKKASQKGRNLKKSSSK